jgi:hypothetical protein
MMDTWFLNGLADAAHGADAFNPDQPHPDLVRA